MFKVLKSFIAIMAVALIFPLIALAQQEGPGDPQPEPALYGEEAGEAVMMQEDAAEDGEEAVAEEDEDDTKEVQAEPVKAMKGQKEPSGQGVTRRSRVANAVQEMLQVAERNEGVGTQIREIAREQNRVHEEMEQGLEAVKERKAWVKFFIGPKYSKVKEAEEMLNKHIEQLGELKDFRAQVKNQEDAQLLQEQLQVMEQIATELKGEVESAKKGFSLFGWFNKWLSNR
ncbi:hypothetical protein KKA33_02780 [Patescibacteria group bacterium]|nr:hypothetical protein [Patescibacteria group bacterium]